MREVVALLTPARLKLALELARLPQGVRGFGHVKERNALAARERQRALLAALGSATPEDGAPARAAA